MSTAPKIVIDPEIKALLPPLTREEFAALGQSLIADGCRDPLVVWEETDILLDGHNRKVICDKQNIPYRVEYLSLPDRAAAVEWVVTTQLGRRNLNDEQHAYYAGKEYLALRQPHGGQTPGGMAHSEPSVSTAERVAERRGTSPATVKRDAAFARAVDAHGAVDPAKREAILAGTSGLTRAQVIATAPVLCPRCLRRGVKAGCKGCKLARRQAVARNKGKAGQPAIELDPAERARKAIGRAVGEAEVLARTVKELLAMPEVIVVLRPLAEEWRLPLEKTIDATQPGYPEVDVWPAAACLPDLLRLVAERLKSDGSS